MTYNYLKQTLIWRTILIKNLVLKFLIFFLIIFITYPVNAFTKVENEQSIAIIPFETISQNDISYIQSGILQMLSSRLHWKDHVSVVNKHTISKHLKKNNSTKHNQTIKAIADFTNADYVLTGSITYFSNAFSVDIKIYDIKSQQYLAFSEQSKIIDDIIPKLNVITAKINKKIFNRKTTIWERLAKQEKEKQLQWKRQNPEKMMPVTPRGEEEEKSSIWKFWEYL